jgi:hypothetical protein
MSGLLYTLSHPPLTMARTTDSFFIRQTVTLTNDNQFQQAEVDLGSYVDALGKSVLRIHNAQVTYSDNTGRSSTVAGAEVAVAQWQLTTQSQGDVVLSSNRAVVSDGRVHMFNEIAAPALASIVTDANGVNLQEWTNGYLIAVEQMYLGGSASTGFAGNVYVSIVLECTVETLSQSGAMALALSQQ